MHQCYELQDDNDTTTYINEKEQCGGTHFKPYYAKLQWKEL